MATTLNSGTQDLISPPHQTNSAGLSDYKNSASA